MPIHASRYAALVAALLLATLPTDSGAAPRVRRAPKAKATSGKAPASRRRTPPRVKKRELGSRIRHRQRSRSRSNENSHRSARTQRVRHERGSTLWVAPGERLTARIKKTMGWKSSDQLFFLTFIGGAGNKPDPATHKAAIAVAKAYARAYKTGKFGKRKLVISSGAAPGLPEAMMEAFHKIAPEVPRVGYSPYGTPADHMKISPWKNLDFIRMIKPIPNYVAGDPSGPGYTLRQDAMLRDASLVVSAGGRFGTGEELFMTLERGKSLVLLTESSGVGVTGGFANMIERGVRAGKVPLAPVTVTPPMDRVKHNTMPKVADRIATRTVERTMRSLSQGQRQHTEQSEARGRPAPAAGVVERMALRPASGD